MSMLSERKEETAEIRELLGAEAVSFGIKKGRLRRFGHGVYKDYANFQTRLANLPCCWT